MIENKRKWWNWKPNESTNVFSFLFLLLNLEFFLILLVEWTLFNNDTLFCQLNNKFRLCLCASWTHMFRQRQRQRRRRRQLRRLYLSYIYVCQSLCHAHIEKLTYSRELHLHIFHCTCLFYWLKCSSSWVHNFHGVLDFRIDFIKTIQYYYFRTRNGKYALICVTPTNEWYTLSN